MRAYERICADLDLEAHRIELTLRKEIPAKEMELIRETGANNPPIGYNLTPRWSEPQ